MESFPPVSKQVACSSYSFPRPFPKSRATPKLVCIGMEQCNPDYIIRREEFGAYGVEFVASGKGELRLNRKKWPLQAGTLFCYGPKTSHTIQSDPHDPMTKFFVDLKGASVAQMLRGTRLEPGRIFYTPEPMAFEALFQSMLLEGSKGGATTHGICLGYFRILLLKTEGVSSTAHLGLDRMASNFQNCRRKIDAHFKSMIDLGDIARHAHLTPAYVCRLFKKFGHPSPYQYLVLKKLNHAAELLLAGATSVKGAAFEVGYKDPCHFSRAFRLHFGTPPAEFAKSHPRRSTPSARRTTPTGS